MQIAIFSVIMNTKTWCLKFGMIDAWIGTINWHFKKKKMLIAEFMVEWPVTR